jgi:hypothetical protein
MRRDVGNVDRLRPPFRWRCTRCYLDREPGGYCPACANPEFGLIESRPEAPAAPAGQEAAETVVTVVESSPRSALVYAATEGRPDVSRRQLTLFDLGAPK